MKFFKSLTIYFFTSVALFLASCSGDSDKIDKEIRAESSEIFDLIDKVFDGILKQLPADRDDYILKERFEVPNEKIVSVVIVNKEKSLSYCLSGESEILKFVGIKGTLGNPIIKKGNIVMRNQSFYGAVTTYENYKPQWDLEIILKLN